MKAYVWTMEDSEGVPFDTMAEAKEYAMLKAKMTGETVYIGGAKDKYAKYEVQPTSDRGFGFYNAKIVKVA